MQTTERTIVLKLIYFWAFVEAALGGLLHLLHIPLTGVIVGGFAVVINVLLASFGDRKPAVFLEALGVVLAVKFLASPHAPVGAYIAVCFQALLAMFVFRAFGLNSISIFLFAVLAMLESALQKPLMAYILFGKEFWIAASGLAADTLHLSKQFVANAIAFTLGIYLLAYAAWGMLLSRWASQLRKQVAGFQPGPVVLQKTDTYSTLLPGQDNSKRARRRWRQYLISAVVVATFAMLTARKDFSLSYVVRTATLFVFFLYVMPFLIRGHQASLAKQNQRQVSKILVELPHIESRVRLAWDLAKENSGLQKIRSFVLYAIWLNVFYVEAKAT